MQLTLNECVFLTTRQKLLETIMKLNLVCFKVVSAFLKLNCTTVSSGKVHCQLDVPIRRILDVPD